MNTSVYTSTFHIQTSSIRTLSLNINTRPPTVSQNNNNRQPWLAHPPHLPSSHLHLQCSATQDVASNNREHETDYKSLAYPPFAQDYYIASSRPQTGCKCGILLRKTLTSSTSAKVSECMSHSSKSSSQIVSKTASSSRARETMYLHH